MKKLLVLLVLLGGCASEADAQCRRHVYDVIGPLGLWCAAVQRPNRWDPPIYELKCHEPIYNGSDSFPIYHGEGWHSVETAWINFANKLDNKRNLNTRDGWWFKKETSTLGCDVYWTLAYP